MEWTYSRNEVINIIKDMENKIKELSTYDVERTHGVIEDAYVNTDVHKVIEETIETI